MNGLASFKQRTMVLDPSIYQSYSTSTGTLRPQPSSRENPTALVLQLHYMSIETLAAPASYLQREVPPTFIALELYLR